MAKKTASKKTMKKAILKSKKKPAKKLKKKTMKKTIKKQKKVSAIPKGYNHITPYLIVEGAAKAIDFYKKVFGAKEVMRMDQQNGKVGHAELRIGDTKIMLADEFPEMGARGPNAFGGTPVGIHLYVKNVDDTAFKAVSAGAELTRQVENMFYGDRSGALRDPFGHMWYIATHVEDLTPMQIKKRAAEFGKK